MAKKNLLRGYGIVHFDQIAAYEPHPQFCVLHLTNGETVEIFGSMYKSHFHDVLGPHMTIYEMFSQLKGGEMFKRKMSIKATKERHP